MPEDSADLRILSLEDVAYDAELIERELRKTGIAYEFKRVDTKQAFLAALDEFLPDIILADYTLPQFSAIEALRLLKKQKRSVPVLLVTGSHSEEAAVECMKEGADDYILKASLTRLPNAVQSTLHKREVERNREATELALKHSQEQYRLITENTRDLICLLDEEDQFDYVSPSHELVLGYPEAELIGTKFLDLIHRDHQAAARKVLEQARRQRQQRTAELLYRDRTGHWQLFEAAASLPADTKGKPRRVVIVSRDVSERKRAEQEIQHLATFPRFNPNPVLAFSADAILVYFNDAAQAMAESFGKEHPRDILPPDTAGVVAKCLGTKQNHIRLDTTIANRTISWTFYPIRPTQSVHCYAEDITDRLSLENQLLRSQKMESIGQLAAGLAHDFNNILTIVQGHSGLLLHDQTTQEHAREALEQICIACERGAGLTRQLLLFSRKQLAQPHIMNLNEIVQEVSKMLRVLLGEHIVLELRLGEELPAVNADEGMMEQVLMNLVVNSRDAMPRGGRIEISTEMRAVDERYARNQRDAHAGEFVCLSVSDTGTGMNEDTLSHMFEPFFTTKEVGKGTGLGLATVYGIVKQHHGWIEVDTREGEGSTFRIYFPATSQPAPAPRPDVATEELAEGSETILVVEDEDSLRDLVLNILRRAGYGVYAAGSGSEALEVWRDHRDEIDLLLTDMMMPEGMTGRELADRILSEDPRMRVLYTSGYPVEIIGADLVSGRHHFLQKPYQPAALASAVRQCLDAPGARRRAGDDHVVKGTAVDAHL
jgi:two-component system, cell cycle sensor histidine kinase and response regulator CckA